MVTIRPERSQDHYEVYRLNELAFGQPLEATLVDKLRAPRPTPQHRSETVNFRVAGTWQARSGGRPSGTMSSGRTWALRPFAEREYCDGWTSPHT